MADAQEPQSENPSPYMRLPWPAVASILFGVLVLLLVAGLYANRNLRPQVGLVATSVPTALAVAAPATTTPQIEATPGPTPLVLATLVVATATPASLATSAPTATPPLPVGSTPSARPTLDPVLAAEVSKAYDQYWQVRSQALLELDKSHLAEVMGGDHLNSVSQRIDQLRAENRAIQTDVDHQSNVVQVNGDVAQLVDDYISNSIYVDPTTKQPLSEAAADELRVLYRLNKIDGRWKVVDSVQAG